MTTHSSILAWRIPRTEESGRLQSMGSQESGHDLATKTTTWKVHSRVGERFAKHMLGDTEKVQILGSKKKKKKPTKLGK